MEQEILTLWQKKVIAFIATEPKLADFYLSGGTALAAYYIFHRFSEDLDFFIFGDFDWPFLEEYNQRLKKEIGATEVRFERLLDRRLFSFKIDAKELKVEFTRYPFLQLENPVLKNGIKIDSLRDIAANKLMAMLERFEPKDFVDLYFIFQKLNINQVRQDAEKKFGIKVDDIFLGGELAKVRRVEGLPKMIKPLTIEDLKISFGNTAKELTKKIF